jgi:hypothetical protein
LLLSKKKEEGLKRTNNNKTLATEEKRTLIPDKLPKKRKKIVSVELPKGIPSTSHEIKRYSSITESND